jgi:hypothetical protein
LVEGLAFSPVDRLAEVVFSLEEDPGCGLWPVEPTSGDMMGEEPTLMLLPDIGGLLYASDSGVAMLRCPAEPCGLGEPSTAGVPDSGDMRGDVNIGGLAGFMVCPDIAGLWWELTSSCELNLGDFSRFDRGDAAAGDLGGDLAFTFLYREGCRRGEGLFSGTMNRSWSLSQSAGSMSGADSLVMDWSFGLNSIMQTVRG